MRHIPLSASTPTPLGCSREPPDNRSPGSRECLDDRLPRSRERPDDRDSRVRKGPDDLVPMPVRRPQRAFASVNDPDDEDYDVDEVWIPDHLEPPSGEPEGRAQDSEEEFLPAVAENRCASGDEPPTYAVVALRPPTVDAQLPESKATSPHLPDVTIQNKRALTPTKMPDDIPPAIVIPKERATEDSETLNDTPVAAPPDVTPSNTFFVEVDPSTILENWYMLVACEQLPPQPELAEGEPDTSLILAVETEPPAQAEGVQERREEPTLNADRYPSPSAAQSMWKSSMDPVVPRQSSRALSIPPSIPTTLPQGRKERDETPAPKAPGELETAPFSRTSTPITPAVASTTRAADSGPQCSAANTPSPLRAHQDGAASPIAPPVAASGSTPKRKRKPLGQRDSADRDKRRNVVQVIISPTSAKSSRTLPTSPRRETSGLQYDDVQPVASSTPGASTAVGQAGPGDRTENSDGRQANRRSSARLSGASQFAETPTRKPAPERTGGELAAASLASFAAVHGTTGLAWEKRAKAAVRAGVDEQTYGPDNLDFVRKQPSQVFAAHYADARNIHAQNAPGRGLNRTDLEEIVDRDGRLLETNGVRQLPNVPKAPLARILEAARSDLPVPGARGRDDLIAARLLDKYTLRARHQAGAGHTSEVKFARVLYESSDDQPSTVQPPLLLASSHFTDLSPQYNKAGGIVLVDVTCTGWHDDKKEIVRIIGQAAADPEEPPTSHSWKHPSGQKLHASVNDIGFSPNGFFLFSCSAQEPLVKIWDTSNGRLYGQGQRGYRLENRRKGSHWRQRAPHFRDLGLQKLAVKRDRKTCCIAAASFDGSTHLFQLLVLNGQPKVDNFHPELPLEETENPDRFRVATTVIFGQRKSNDLLATGYERIRGNVGTGKIRYFDITSSQLVTEHDVGENAVACFAFCPDGSLLVAGATGNAPLPGEDHAEFLTTTGDGLVRIFDTRKMLPAMSLTSSQLDHNVVGFSPCGQYVYSCSDPGGESRVPHSVVYDIRNTRDPVLCETMVLPHSAAQPGHEGDGVTCAAWHGNLFFTGGQDECVRAWDVRRSPADRIRRTFACKDGPISALALAPGEGDGNDDGDNDQRLLPEWMAVGTTSGAVHLWALGEGKGVVEVWDEAIAGGRVAGEWIYSAD
ncbi:hypothetical protein HDU87_006522 [Geranomyces variabilis]|uniref:WD40 repeat-like protein n=1 Tax=Geranomyces variabilis TaxID=109894 RepID=A0AAD5THR4_9FUNG|nr:hypothetical protein HDU87_006522 [Geranomyces variabilis]